MVSTAAAVLVRAAGVSLKRARRGRGRCPGRTEQDIRLPRARGSPDRTGIMPVPTATRGRMHCARSKLELTLSARGGVSRRADREPRRDIARATEASAARVPGVSARFLVPGPPFWGQPCPGQQSPVGSVDSIPQVEISGPPPSPGRSGAAPAAASPPRSPRGRRGPSRPRHGPPGRPARAARALPIPPAARPSAGPAMVPRGAHSARHYDPPPGVLTPLPLGSPAH